MANYLSDTENDNHLNDSLLGNVFGNNIIDNPFFLVPIIPYDKEIPIYSIPNLNENYSEGNIISSSIIESSNGDNSSIEF